MPIDQGENPIGRGLGAGYAIVSAGFQLAFSIVFFMGMGYLADRWLGSRPVLMLIGTLVGGATGFYAFFRRVMAEAGRGRPPRHGGT